jgi:hypothetical protein
MAQYDYEFLFCLPVDTWWFTHSCSKDSCEISHFRASVIPNASAGMPSLLGTNANISQFAPDCVASVQTASDISAFQRFRNTGEFLPCSGVSSHSLVPAYFCGPVFVLKNISHIPGGVDRHISGTVSFNDFNSEPKLGFVFDG